MKIWHICLIATIMICLIGYGKQYINETNGSGIYEIFEGEQREYQCEPWELVPEKYVSYMVINDDYFNATLVSSCRVYNDWIATMPTYFVPMGIIFIVIFFIMERNDEGRTEYITRIEEAIDNQKEDQEGDL